LSVVPLKIGKNNCKPGEERAGKRRLFAKSQPFTGSLVIGVVFSFNKW